MLRTALQNGLINTTNYYQNQFNAFGKWETEKIWDLKYRGLIVEKCERWKNWNGIERKNHITEPNFAEFSKYLETEKVGCYNFERSCCWVVVSWEQKCFENLKISQNYITEKTINFCVKSGILFNYSRSRHSPLFSPQRNLILIRPIRRHVMQRRRVLRIAVRSREVDSNCKVELSSARDEVDERRLDDDSGVPEFQCSRWLVLVAFLRFLLLVDELEKRGNFLPNELNKLSESLWMPRNWKKFLETISRKIFFFSFTNP